VAFIWNVPDISGNVRYIDSIDLERYQVMIEGAGRMEPVGIRVTVSLTYVHDMYILQEVLRSGLNYQRLGQGTR